MKNVKINSNYGVFEVDYLWLKEFVEKEYEMSVKEFVDTYILDDGDRIYEELYR